jgi:hypothetical protein
MPFLSKDIVIDEGRIYSQLSTGLQDVFSWISDQVGFPEISISLDANILFADRTKPS